MFLERINNSMSEKQLVEVLNEIFREMFNMPKENTNLDPYGKIVSEYLRLRTLEFEARTPHASPSSPAMLPFPHALSIPEAASQHPYEKTYPRGNHRPLASRWAGFRILLPRQHPQSARLRPECFTYTRSLDKP